MKLFGQQTSLVEAQSSSESPIEILRSSRVMAHALANSFPVNTRLELARAFGVSLVKAWWNGVNATYGSKQRIRSFVKEFAYIELPAAASSLAGTIGEAAAKLDAESAAYEIGLTYTSMLPPEHRGDYGIYYTPPSLTARLIDQATEAGMDWTLCRVLDPACGGGAFLAPIAQRIMDELGQCSPHFLVKTIGSRLKGYEIDPFGAWLSQVTLDTVLLPATVETKRKLPVVVSVCDSLSKSPQRSQFDLVIGNPPYGRTKLDPEIRDRYKRSLYGHANLYGLFTDLALRHVKPGGVVSYVTPTSFLAGVYFKNLRALLGRSAPPQAIDFVSTRKGVFDDVLQETALATYKCGGELTKVGVNELIVSGRGVEVRRSGSVSLPVDPSLPWLLPRNNEQAKLVERLGGMPCRLSDWGYTVKTGPLVWNRFKSQLVKRQGKSRLPLIWAEAVTSDGRFVFRAEKKNHEPYFQVKEKDGWLVTREPCVLLQRTTAKEQNRRLIAAVLPKDFIDAHGGVVIENHLNMVRPVTMAPQVDAETLGAFLNSGAADRAFRCVSGSVAVSAYELESLPLPAPEELANLAELVESGGSKEMIEKECSRLVEGAGFAS